ncbi:MAG: AI-2E family transporter [Methylobacteriaceae bacterium]|nr:AI-2E family transporter [Methylobacteriaceae bacterium]
MSEGYSSDRRGEVEATAPGFGANSLLITAIVVGGLWAAREVLIPAVLAVLLSFVLAGPARLLRRWNLGRGTSVTIVVVLAFMVIASIGAVLTTQLTRLAGDLPQYQWTIRDKITSLREAATGRGPLERAAEVLSDLSSDLTGGANAQRPAPGPAAKDGQAAPPVPVEIRPTKLGPFETVAAYLKPALHPLATVGLVAILVVFILLSRDDLRNRLIRLAGSHDLQRTTAAMNDAAARLSRFFLTQVLLNASFGLVVGLGLWLIGVPTPILWGILAAISRFIPYVGVLIAAGGPLLLSAAVDPGWSMLAMTAGFFVLIEFVVGQVIEPLLYGHSTGLTPVAVIASVTFWTWLWGPAGLLLATPLTVCLVVLGRHVEGLRFLDVMFGDRPPLTLAESFYQRMLAGDTAEALEQAEDFLKSHSLTTYYDEVALHGLALAEVDQSRGALTPERLARIDATVADLVDELEEWEEPAAAEPAKAEEKRADGDANIDATLLKADASARRLQAFAADRIPAAWRDRAPVLCVAGRDQLDRAGALMLAQLLERHGLRADVESADLLHSSRLFALDGAGRHIVCLSFLDSSSPVTVRYAVRRLRRKLPEARILVGIWSLSPEATGQACEAARSDVCVTRLCDAVQDCLEWAAAAADAEAQPSGLPQPRLTADAA